MKPDSPLRAEADGRFTDRDSNIQTNLFDQDFVSTPSPTGLHDYRQNYGLSEDPFSDDPGFPLFTGGGRRQLLDQLLHLCQFSNQLLVITGEQGVGKTRIAHALADSLEEQDQLCFLALSPGQSLEQILIAIAESFNLDVSQSTSVDTLLSEIENYISENFSVDNEEDSEGLVLIIIDNAEHLDTQSIAVLASLVENKTQHNSLHLVLVGEPLLVSRLNGVESENLQISDFHLPALSLSETVDYLNFRMEMADYLGAEFFTDAMVDPWWRQARGQLSIVHELAQDKLLQSVTPETIKTRSHFPIFHIIAISLVIAVAMVLYLYLDDNQPAGELNIAIANQSAPTLSSSVQSASIATQVESSATGSIALATMQTPTQPLLPSLPDNNLVTNNVVSSANTESPTQLPVQMESVASSTPRQLSAMETKASASNNVIDSEIKNNPPAVSSVDTSRLADPTPKDNTSRFTADEKTILAWSSNQFTIQLIGVSSLKAAKEFVSEQTNASDLLIFKTRRAGKDWFVVVTGHYASNAKARAAILQLPAAQREAGPWPRHIKIIQDEIRK